MSEKWAEEAEEIAEDLLSNDEADAGVSKLLEISPTNRTIATRDQAIVLATLRFAGYHYKKLYANPDYYGYFDFLADTVESYQLTVSGEENSRRQFMKTWVARATNIFKFRRGDTLE